MLKKSLFLILFLLLFSFTVKAYAVSPTTTYALSGSLTATTSSGIQFFTLSGSSNTITGSNEAIGSITYSNGAFSGSITIENSSGNITLSGSGNTISYNGSSITYDSSTNTFSGSIPLSLTENLTTPATCSDGSTPTNGTCPSGAYLTCESGYTLSGDTCSETVSGSFTLSGSNSNIDISGGSSRGSISMLQTQSCPTGYTLSNGSCVSNTDAGTTSTFACTNGTNYQNCDAGSTFPSGSAYLCPLGQTQCNENTSTPQCPSGYTLSNNTCTSSVSASCPSGYSWNGSTCTETITTTTNPTASGGWQGWLDSFTGAIASGNTITFHYVYDTGGYGTFNITLSGATASGGWSGYNLSEWGGGDTLIGATASGNTITFYVGGGSVGTFNITLSGATASGGWIGDGESDALGGDTLTGATASGNTITFYYSSYYGYYSGTFNITLNGTSTTSTQTTSPTCPSGYTLSGDTCTATTSATCPSGTTLINNQCVSYSCPLNGTPQGSAPGQNYTCVEPSGSSQYYCSPYFCYNDTTNTPISTKETMPPAQTNNGTITSSGCQGSIYIFPGQALQCTRFYVLGENCCSRSKYLLGGRNCSSNSQILAEAIIYDNQYSPPVPVYSGSGDPDTAPITSCSQSAIANGCGQQGEAIYIGNYCSLKLPLVGTCLAQTYVFCKFQGLLATLIQAQGRAQLAGGPDAVSWGSVSSPNCTGFTPTQFQELNFANMNLTQYIDVVKNQVSNTLTTSAIQTQISNTTQSIGNVINQLETGGALNGTIP